MTEHLDLLRTRNLGVTPGPGCDTRLRNVTKLNDKAGPENEMLFIIRLSVRFRVTLLVQYRNIIAVCLETGPIWRPNTADDMDPLLPRNSIRPHRVAISKHNFIPCLDCLNVHCLPYT